jgi:CDP-diglyceride synthetase
LRQGGFSDLGRRVATAAVALPLLLAGLLLGPPLLAVAIVAAAALLGTAELFALLAKGGIAPLRATGFVVMAAVFVDVARPGGLPGSAWPFAAVALLASMLLRSRDIALAVPSGAGTLLAAAYLGGLGGSIAALRVLPPLELGPWRLLLLLAIVMARTPPPSSWAAPSAAGSWPGHLAGQDGRGADRAAWPAASWARWPCAGRDCTRYP